MVKSQPSLIIPAKIGIIGYGIVGQALAYGFSKVSRGKNQIFYYDKYKDSLPLEEVIARSEFVFIALPTPMMEDESGIDLSIVEENIKEITKYTNGTNKIIIVKSTVTPGTTTRFEKKYKSSKFAFNPEFLTEANFLDDFLNAEKTIIGANDDLVARRIAVLYKQRFPKTTIYQTDPTTAESVKYFANVYLATKVTFANFFYDFCQKIGIKYEEVKKMAATDPRIVDSHLDVTTVRGFGQKCLPKDLVALIGEFKKHKVNVSLFEAVWEYNKKIRKIHDWIDVPFAVSGNYKKLAKNQKIDHKGLNKLMYS